MLWNATSSWRTAAGRDSIVNLIGSATIGWRLLDGVLLASGWRLAGWLCLLAIPSSTKWQALSTLSRRLIDSIG